MPVGQCANGLGVGLGLPPPLHLCVTVRNVTARKSAALKIDFVDFMFFSLLLREAEASGKKAHRPE